VNEVKDSISSAYTVGLEHKSVTNDGKRRQGKQYELCVTSFKDVNW